MIQLEKDKEQKEIAQLFENKKEFIEKFFAIFERKYPINYRKIITFISKMMRIQDEKHFETFEEAIAEISELMDKQLIKK